MYFASSTSSNLDLFLLEPDFTLLLLFVPRKFFSKVYMSLNKIKKSKKYKMNLSIV